MLEIFINYNASLCRVVKRIDDPTPREQKYAGRGYKYDEKAIRHIQIRLAISLHASLIGHFKSMKDR